MAVSLVFEVPWCRRENQRTLFAILRELNASERHFTPFCAMTPVLNLIDRDSRSGGRRMERRLRSKK